MIVRLRGRFREPRPDVGAGITLIVEDRGRHHRFPALGDSHIVRDGAWSFSFAVPAWFAPRLTGRMMLQVGDTIALVDEAAMTDEGRAEAAEAEATALRSEVERLGRELAAARSRTTGRQSGLVLAQELLAEARDVTDRLRRD